jgi:predicted nucleotidyltransferase
MYIDPENKIAGQATLRVRTFIRRAWDSWNVEYVREFFQVSHLEARQIIEALSSEGYIERDGRNGKGEWWTTTIKGNSFGLASAARPLRRSTADKKVKEFLERVHQVNSSDYFLYKVRKALVFGSYLSNQDRINDIDLAVELEPKHKDRAFQHQLEEARSRKAAREGRQFHGMIDQLLWSKYEVILFLKSRSRAISLHETSDPILEQTKPREIFSMGENRGSA